MDKEQFTKEYNSVFFTPDKHYEYALKSGLNITIKQKYMIVEFVLDSKGTLVKRYQSIQ